MGKLTDYCGGCPKVDLTLNECSAYENTSWVVRLGGCCINKVGVVIKTKTVGQQKGRRKIVGSVDLTQAGLFPEWNAIGIGWKSGVYLSKKVGSQTPGRDKPFGKASKFARYCAYYSRAQYHRDYPMQKLVWAKANR